MACSKFEYVKHFESQEKLLPSTYIVVRIDGKGFTKFTTAHNFEKPNDHRGISLMNKAALVVVNTFPEIWFAYGQSDEYSFILRKNSTLYNRRADKIATTMASCFAASYTLYFKDFFPGHELKEIPMFDGRCICYPSDEILRDYCSWRQADCHINNMYNTCFWALVQQGGQSMEDAHKFLKGTDSAQKNELLFSKFEINYAKIDPIWRKGTIYIRIPKDIEVTEFVKEEAKEAVAEGAESGENVEKKPVKNKKNKSNYVKEDGKPGKEPRKKWEVMELHEDVIGNEFWEKYKESLLL